MFRLVVVVVVVWLRCQRCFGGNLLLCWAGSAEDRSPEVGGYRRFGFRVILPRCCWCCWWCWRR